MILHPATGQQDQVVLLLIVPQEIVIQLATWLGHFTISIKEQVKDVSTPLSCLASSFMNFYFKYLDEYL
jgi:hypothetical protein